MPDGTLIFDTKLDTSELESSISRLRSQMAAEQGFSFDLNPTVDDSKVRSEIKKVESAIDKADSDVTIDTEIDESDVRKEAEGLADEIKAGLKNAGEPFDSDGNLKIKTELDTAGTDQTARRAGQVGDIIKGALGAELIRDAGRTLVDFSKDAVMAASDLQEVQNVVDVTFGDTAGLIDDFAANGAKAFGLTELQTKRYTGTLGALFKSMGLGQDEVTEMSIAMASLVGDMASFYNLDYDTAFEKLRSGISGETEPLKQLGINLSVANLNAFAMAEGMDATYDSMTEAEKAMLRYEYILSATADAQGDFERTYDGFANQLRTLDNNIDTLKTNIGTYFIPVVNSAVTALNDLFSGNDGNKSQLQQDIDDAITSINSIETEITGIKNNYANTVLKISVDYASSQQLLDDYAALEGIEDKSEEQMTQMQSIVQSLLELYPQLSEHVGADGLFSQESAQVQGLIDEYNELARVKAYAQMVEDVYAQFLKAKFEYAQLQEKETIAGNEITALEREYAALSELERILHDPDRLEAWEVDLFGPAALDVDKIKDAAGAMREYIEIFGGFDESTLAGFTDAGVDLTTFIDQLNDPSQMGMDGILNLLKALEVIENAGIIDGKSLETLEKLDQAQTAAQTANQALVDGTAAVSSAQTELETALSGYEKLTGTTGDALVTSIRTAIEGGAETINTSAGELNAQMVQNIADTTSIPSAMSAMESSIASNLRGMDLPTVYFDVKPRYSDVAIPGAAGRGHATGLDYVPYNGYAALLHRGEAVLRASDAAAWRSGQTSSGSDTDALAALAQSMQAVASRPVKVYVGEKEIITALADGMRSEINTINRSRALGVGK